MASSDLWQLTPTRIGEGVGSREVYAGFNTLSGAKVAVKVYRSTEQRKIGHREARILKAASVHPNVVHLLAVQEDPERLSLVLEYCGGGDLLSLAIIEPRYVRVRARRFFRQILSGVDFLHACLGIAHRDLRLEHFLLNTHHTQVVIAGLGRSEHLCNEPFTDACCASLPYAAPEIVSRVPYCGEPADIWALGVVLYAMLYSVFPFGAESVDELSERILREEAPYPEQESEAEVVCLLRRMLHKDPALRASLAEIRHWHWVSEGPDFAAHLA